MIPHLFLELVQACDKVNYMICGIERVVGQGVKSFVFQVFVMNGALR